MRLSFHCCYFHLQFTGVIVQFGCGIVDFQEQSAGLRA